MSTLPLSDLRRCARTAIAPSLAVLTLTAALRLITHATPPELIPVVAPLHLAILGAVACSLVWLLVATLVSATEPGRDARAAGLRVALHERAEVPGRALVEVQRITWSSPAGQHLFAVDVHRGTRHDLWLCEATLAVGSFAVLDLSTDPIRVVDWLDHKAVARARRHDALANRRQRPACRANRARARQERGAAEGVVEEAERILRST